MPGTLGPDGDPLDAMILHDIATFPGMLVPSRPVAILEVQQSEGDRSFRNDRVLFVPAKQKQAPPLGESQKRALEAFFLGSVAGTGKKLEFLGWRDADRAEAEVDSAAQRSAVDPAAPDPGWTCTSSRLTGGLPDEKTVRALTNW